MPLSHAEATYEYQLEEIDRLKKEIMDAKGVIERNQERLDYLDTQLDASVRKIVGEHPATAAPEPAAPKKTAKSKK